MTTPRQRALGLSAAGVAVVVFSLSVVMVKWPGLPGSTIAWWRLVGSAVLWWGFLLVRRARTGTPLPSRRDWAVTTPAALASGITISMSFLALTRTSVVHAVLIGSLSPLLLIPAGYLVFRERPYWRALMWGGVSLIGLYIVLTNGPAGGAATIAGDVIAVVGMLGFVGYQIGSKWARLAEVGPFNFMGILTVVGLVTATPVALWNAGDSLWQLNAHGWIVVAALAVGTGVVGHLLLYYAQRSVPLGTLAIVQTSQPAQAALLAWIFLGEALTAAQIPGLILALAGIALVMWQSSRSPQLAESRDGEGGPNQVESTEPVVT